MKHSRSVPQFGRLLSILVVALSMNVTDAVAQTQRLLGLDISAWQGDISQTTWNNIRNVENRQFVVLRSSRGGTTGYYNQNDSANSQGLNTLSQRYDDPYFIQNVNRASAAGMFVGTYHFSRPDIMENTLNSGGIRNNGTDEADHFIQMAGPWMRPGYLPPVHDLEAGISQRTSDEQAQFAIDFSNRIYEKMGIRPAVYTSGSYAADLQAANAPLPDLLAKPPALLPSMVSPAYPVLWSARWPNQTNPAAINVQIEEPKDSYTPIYGPWDNYGTTHPWVFWQYASTVRLQSFQNGGSNLDADVLRGGMEFLKDNLIPAVWMNDGNGQWTTLTNWNSGVTPTLPVPGPGQGAPVGTLTLPTPRLPSTNDTIILERPNANITVTLASGTQNIRKLYVREALDITGGSLTMNFTPSSDSTTNAAQFSAPVSINNATLNVHTLQVDAAQTFTVGGGTLKFSQINLMPGGTPATLAMGGNATFNAWSNGVCNIVNGSGSGSSGRVDLGGGARSFSVPTGVDMSLDVPVQNGALTKSGGGTLRLTSPNTYANGTVVTAGKLYVNNSTGSGTGSGSVTVDGTLGGLGTISGIATINSGGTVAPGTDAAIGTLTFGSSPVLNGTSFFRINRNNGSPLSDRMSRPGGALAFGGTLFVSNAGAALTGGEVFAPFSAASYSGAFTATNLPTLGTGLNWYLGNLSVDGTLIVNRKPTVSSVAFNSTPGQTLTIPIATLIGSGSDPDGDTLSLASFDPATTNGITLSSDGTNIYYLNNADVGDQFNYTISDGRGGSATGAVLIGQGVPTSPLILSGPYSLTVLAGQDATFSVSASGTGPLSYQWRFNTTNIGGATATNYTRANAQTIHAGSYSVIVTNPYGSASASATLTIATPATITVQPQSTNAALGQTVTLTVGASGTGPLSYQWWFKTNLISQATTSNLVVTIATTNQLGGYYAIVSNAYGSATSQVATVTLGQPMQVLWRLAPYDRTYLTTNDLPEQRGMTFNSVTHRLLLVNRTNTTVHVLNENGADLWTLNTNGVTGGLNTFYYLLLIAAADDGAIYACNLKAGTSPFKIYRWANDNSNTVPTVAFTGDPSPGTSGYRWGDTFDVRGSGTNTQILIGPRQGTNVVLFTTTNSVDFTPRVINLNGIPEGHCGLNLTFGNGNTFWGTTHTNLLRLVSFDPVAGTASTLRLYSDTEVPTAVNPIGFSPALNMFAGINISSPNHLRIYDVSPTNGVPFLIGTTNFATDNSNTHTATGAVRFGGDVVYALDANNGLMAVRIYLPNPPLRFTEMSRESGQPFILRGTGTVGNYAVEATSTPFTDWTTVTNVAIGMNGSFEYQENLTNAVQRFYRVRKQ
ncbi:MAG: Lysozyme [Verrucomicrobiales bacterium]|nr:Lysozyme [Verrucomicrobiales bacterium]